MRTAQNRELKEMRRLKYAGEWIDIGSARWFGAIYEVREAIFLWDDDEDPLPR